MGPLGLYYCFGNMAALLTLASFIAIAVFASGSNALETSKLLMRDVKNATELFEIATKDMENWHSTYLQAIKEFHQKMLPEYICPDVSVPLNDLTILEKQIEKIRECRQEKFEQLNVLEGIADTMSSLNKTETLEQLKDTIEHLNKTAHVEDIELKKEEDEVMALNVTIQSYVCDCTYNSWGDWGSCSKTCGEDRIKSRSRDVRWNATNGGKACLGSDQDSSLCDNVCCPVDCTWEEWGEWSACPDECEVSKVFRTREKNEHKCGGRPCTGLARKEKQCDRFAEVKMETDQCEQNLENAAEEIKRLNEKLCQNVSCLDGDACQEGKCSWDCNKDSHCTGGQVCLDNKCWCMMDVNCPSGQVCVFADVWEMYGTCMYT